MGPDRRGRIREATTDPRDIDALVRCRIGMYTDMGIPVDVPDDRLRFSRWFEDAIASGLYRAWFAVAADDTIAAAGGVMVLPWPPGPAGTAGPLPVVFNVYTDPAYRRRGLARLIMTTIHEWCRAVGYDRVALQASQFGEPLYIDMGYRPPAQPYLVLDLRRR